MVSTTNVNVNMALEMCGDTAVRYSTISHSVPSSMAGFFVSMEVLAQPWQLWTRQVFFLADGQFCSFISRFLRILGYKIMLETRS